MENYKTFSTFGPNLPVRPEIPFRISHSAKHLDISSSALANMTTAAYLQRYSFTA